jgi:hypothetical protein
MRHTIAFDQIRLLVDEVVDLWIEKELYKSRLLASSDEFTPETLEQALRLAKNDPETRRKIEARFAGLRQSLDELGQALILEEIEKELPPPDQSN